MYNNEDLYGKKASHFRQSRRLTLAVSQAAGPLWEFRWAPVITTGICLVNRVILRAVQTGAATAEALPFSLKVARTFTVADATNTASILRTGDDQKLNGDHANSVLADFRESNSATAAAGGTKTLDTDAIALGTFVSIAAASTTESGGGYLTLFDLDPIASGDQPLRLESNEGWVLSLDTGKGATQGVDLILTTSWSEIAPIS